MLSSPGEFIFSALVGGLGLMVAIGYVGVRLRLRPLREGGLEQLDSAAGLQRRSRRRLLGVSVLSVVSVALFLGINYIDAMRFPVEFAVYWMIVLCMVLWLLALALADIRHTVRLQRDWTRRRAQAAFDRYVKVHRRMDTREPEHGELH